MEDRPKGVQIIRTIRENGITVIYNFHGDTKNGFPIKQLIREQITDTLIRVTDPPSDK